MRSFQDLQGKEVALGRFLGRGGEGAVYAVPMRPGLVAKIYVRTPDNHMGRKLAAMVQLGTEALTSLAAWPQDLLLDERTGNVVGFLMPRVEDHRGIHALYGPTNRKTAFPDATWAFLVRTARNVAATFDTVHQHGHVIGDVNEGNIVVSQKATVRLIDCDSFQITHLGRTYPCRVGVPLYTPPELQGKRLEDVVRTPEHDRFGLAVLVFQLLFMGRHPFAGLHPERAIPVGMAIREGLFAFGQEAARQRWEPPPFSLRLTDVSSSVAQLFEGAFGKDAAAGGPRPTAAKWVTALGELEAEAVICSHDPLHVKINASCPWCRIEKEGGPSFFLDPNRIVTAAVLGSSKLTDAEIEAFAAMKNVSYQVLRQIGTNKDWTKKYSVVANLVRNPRTPIGIAMTMVSRLTPRDMKAVALDKNVPEAIRKAAQKFVRPPGGGPVEQELVMRLGGLMVKTRSSFQALESKLIAEERDQVLNAIDRFKTITDGGIDDLRRCVEELERALRLLEAVRSRG